jgi:hypothetical protein
MQNCPVASVNGKYAPSPAAGTNVYTHESNNFKLVNDNGWFIYDMKDVLYYPPASAWEYYSEKLQKFRVSKNMALLPEDKSSARAVRPLPSTPAPSGAIKAPTPPTQPSTVPKLNPQPAPSPTKPLDANRPPPAVSPEDNSQIPVIPLEDSVDVETQFYALLESAAAADSSLKVFLKDQENNAESAYTLALSNHPMDYVQLAALGKAKTLLQSRCLGVNTSDSLITAKLLQQRSAELEVALRRKCDAVLLVGDFAALEHYGRMLHYVVLLGTQLTPDLRGVPELGAVAEKIRQEGNDNEDDSFLDPVLVQP